MSKNARDSAIAYLHKSADDTTRTSDNDPPNLKKSNIIDNLKSHTKITAVLSQDISLICELFQRQESFETDSKGQGESTNIVDDSNQFN